MGAAGGSTALDAEKPSVSNRRRREETKSTKLQEGIMRREDKERERVC